MKYECERYADAQPFIRALKRSAKWLSAQEYRTLKGQALKGDLAGAVRGLKKLLDERDTEVR